MSATVAVMATDPRIGTTIKRARERKRWTQQQLADAVGVSRSAVNAWETDRAYPRNAIGALEEVLGISLDDDISTVAAQEMKPSKTPEEALDRALSELSELREALRREPGKDQDENGGRRAG